MPPIDHARLTELFAEVMDLDASGQRELIARVQEADPTLAGELAAMLDADHAIVTALRTAGLRPSDVDASFGRGRRPGPPVKIEIPNFRIRHALGEGGMGVVFEAEQLEPPRIVAIKVLHPFSSAEARERFEAESVIMKKLDHDGIARVLDSGEANGRPFFVMERIEGTTLSTYLRDHAPARRIRLALFEAICDAVQHAHDQGVVHRDLKPANIMVRPDGRITILDFGVARAAAFAGRTQQGDFLGTLLYMSPEQATGRANQIDARTDIYALGILLFELIAGTMPYDLAGLHIAQAVRRIVHQAPRPLASGDPGLDDIAARALAKLPADRFGSAAQLAAEIRAAIART